MVCLTSVLAAAAEEMEDNGKNCEDVEAAVRYISFIFPGRRYDSPYQRRAERTAYYP